MIGAARQDFQYANPRHQAETAIAGMWLFLATEVLFFGGLFLDFLQFIHGCLLGGSFRSSLGEGFDGLDRSEQKLLRDRVHVTSWIWW